MTEQFTIRQAPLLYQPFCTEAIPEPVQSYIRGGAKALGCEESFIALPMLSALGAAVGNTRRIQLKQSWTECAVLWTAIVGESGTLKSPAIDLALRPMRKIQNQAFCQYEEKMTEYRKELAEYEKQKLLRKKSPVALEKPQEPIALRYICSDITIEALAQLLMQNPRGLLAARDELSGWIKGFNSYKKTKGGDEAAWLELFRAGTLLVDRKAGIPKTIYVPNAAVSVCGGIQPEILRSSLGREYFENGLAARLLLAMPPRTAKRWNEADVDKDVVEEVEGVFEGLLRMQFHVDGFGNAAAKLLPLTLDGQEAWIAFYDRHAQEQAGLEGGDLAAAFSKLEGYAARFALIVHCVRAAGGDTTLVSDDYVDAESVRRAVVIVQWFCNETRRIYAMFQEGDEQAEQRKLLEIVQGRGGQISVRDLMQASRAYRGGAGVAQFALDELVKIGLGHWQKEQTGGRPCDVFILHGTTDTQVQKMAT